MKKKVVTRRSSIAARKPPAKRRRWLGIRDEGLGLSTLPDPKYDTSEAREVWPGLAQVLQEGIIDMNNELDRNPDAIPARTVKALLACGEIYFCNLDAREEEADL